MIRKSIFTPEAIANIEKTGNVWGHSAEYDFKFSIRIWRRTVSFEQKSKRNLWGRFGGGWDFKLGIQAGSLKSIFLLKDVIISLFTMSIRINKGD